MSSGSAKRPGRTPVHGLSHSPEYHAWEAMLGRCYRPTTTNYRDYGGRGIRVTGEWRGTGGFLRFLAHVGTRPSPKHSIDRIDVNGNYESGNVRWATAKEQSANRRDNTYYEFAGRRMLAADWARELGISRNAIPMRLAAGWPAEKIFTTGPTRADQRGRLRGSTACSVCRERGHNKATCPTRARAA